MVMKEAASAPVVSATSSETMNAGHVADTSPPSPASARLPTRVDAMSSRCTTRRSHSATAQNATAAPHPPPRGRP